MSSPLLFDDPDYCATLAWLGRAVEIGGRAALLRPLPGGLADARGSWPYGTAPDAGGTAALHGIVSLCRVLRPDTGAALLKGVQARERGDAGLRLVPLKPHLGHRADLPPARDGYSARTRRRLARARALFSIQREEFGRDHLVAARWQEDLRRQRAIARISSPDPAHFAALATLPPQARTRMATITLRWRQGGGLAGIFLAGRGERGQSWHAHSALTEARARAAYGAYLLFDGAVEILGQEDLWFGGAPQGANGAGVLRFKQRFSNVSAPAHLLYEELDPQAAAWLRQRHGSHDFLPDYRDPTRELSWEGPDG